MSLPQILSQLSGGMVRTVGIFFLTLIFSLPLGLVISFGRMAKNPVLKNLFKIYISVMRGTPLMLQLMVFYFGPYYLFKMNIGGNWRFTAIILSFSLNYAAYFAEIYRSGIESMPVGQYEAAKLLGYSRSQTFFRIIFPQVVKRIPGLRCGLYGDVHDCQTDRRVEDYLCTLRGGGHFLLCLQPYCRRCHGKTGKTHGLLPLRRLYELSRNQSYQKIFRRS